MTPANRKNPAVSHMRIVRGFKCLRGLGELTVGNFSVKTVMELGFDGKARELAAPAVNFSITIMQLS
jgi:hypothetical protein